MAQSRPVIGLRVPEGTLRTILVVVQVLLVVAEVLGGGLFMALSLLPVTLLMALGSFVVLVQMKDRAATELWRKMKHLIGES